MQYVFIHGLGQTSLSWQKTIDFLSKTNDINSPDLWPMLNHKEFTYANLYHTFSNYCNGITGKLNLCGLSLGGILALNYAIDYPEKVQSIVLIGTQYKIPKGLFKFQNLIFRLLPEKSFAKMGLPKKSVLQLTNSMVNLDFSPSNT